MPGKDPGFDAEEHLDRLKPGALLLSRDLSDPNFNETVLLVCGHGPEGSYGLVLNRPSHMPMSEVFDQPPAWVGSEGMRDVLTRKQRVFIGGPVQPEALQILQVTAAPVPGSHAVYPQVYLGGYWNDLKDVLDTDPNAMRLFLGYSGWGPEQLLEEIRLGAWEVWEVDVKKLLLAPEEPWLGGIARIKGFLSTL